MRVVKKSAKKAGSTSKSGGRKKTAGKRRRKHTARDALRAAALTAVLIAVSALISAAVIFVRSSAKRPVEALPPLAGPAAVPGENPPASQIPAELPAEKPSPVSAPAGGAVAPEPLPRRPPETAPAVSPSGVKPAPVPAANPPAVSTPKPPAPSKPGRVEPAQPGVPPEQPKPPKPRRRGTVVFVIDDAGNNLRELEPFLRIPGPLTIAVLPGLPHSAEAARRIRAAGKEVFLHQPMEAIGGQNPGPGAVYSGMTGAEIRTVLAANVAEIGPVAGMNNHQGSRITMDMEAMETILAFCREHGIYFLDSRTTAETAAPGAAKRLGIKIGERDVFIDNIQEKASMIRYIEDGLRKADQKGAAVMIGHTWSSELAATLEELYPGLVEEGYSLSTISRFMMERDYDSSWD
ncbi:MAG: divergent polysaccharide deacetylase family protein [Treponema sp.]|jgi:polysaccharide deacetylase 2 family uncharacterized protein YibQ|nr:divergent polysaccharide deacetylase family protein [Treponema sp.]